MAAEYRTSDCRGCEWHFLSPSRDLRPPEGSLGPPGLSLALFRSRECARAGSDDGERIHFGTSVSTFIPRS